VREPLSKAQYPDCTQRLANISLFTFMFFPGKVVAVLLMAVGFFG